MVLDFEGYGLFDCGIGVPAVQGFRSKYKRYRAPASADEAQSARTSWHVVDTWALGSRVTQASLTSDCFCMHVAPFMEGVGWA